MDLPPALSIQERLYPDLTCFGCGMANSKGLQLRSYPSDDAVVATFQPWPEHDNGGGFLNGGIIATILDCHSGAAVLHEGDRRGWGITYVTAGLDVRYLRPTPLNETLHLHATIVAAQEDEMTAEVKLTYNDKTLATASALWKRWRPRTAQP